MKKQLDPPPILINNPPMKTNYAFDFAAEIVSNKEFHEIPVADLVDAMIARLLKVKENDEKEAFSFFDSFEEKEEIGHLGDGE